MNRVHNKDIVLLLTACINPQGMAFTALQDAEERKNQYIEAIRYYISNTRYKIVVVENTLFDLTSFFIPEERLEFLTFEGNSFDKTLGKGYGEGLIMNYAFSNSKLIEQSNHIIKISGRHIISNVIPIVKISNLFYRMSDGYVICQILPSLKEAISDMFIASKSFYKCSLLPNLKKCNDTQGVWFEHVFYECLLEASKQQEFKYSPLPFALSQRGLSGSEGWSYKPVPFKRQILTFYRFLKFLFFKPNRITDNIK